MHLINHSPSRGQVRHRPLLRKRLLRESSLVMLIPTLARPRAQQNQDYCLGSCGTFGIYFPVANVLYSPMSLMNTACLENKTTTASRSMPRSISSPSMLEDLYPRSAESSESQTVSNGYTLYLDLVLIEVNSSNQF